MRLICITIVALTLVAAGCSGVIPTPLHLPSPARRHRTPRSAIQGVISTLAERGDIAGAFREAVSAMKGTAPGMSREERILATIACHSAVKLGDKLSYEEMRGLIKEWLTSRYPATCPHGRSICYRIEHKEIARKLDRH